jgi:hypothetical protein
MASTLGLEGIEAIMFRTGGDRPASWESLLPAEVLQLPEELERVDASLDDPAFFAPFAAYFHEKAAAEAVAVLRNGRRALPGTLTGRVRGRPRRALDELAVTIERTGTIVAQTRSRLAGQMPESAVRLVSLHDPDARPIRKGRIDRPVEFGYKAQVIDNDDGVVLDYGVEYGAAPDGPQLAPAIKRVARRALLVPPRGHRRPRLRPGSRRA